MALLSPSVFRLPASGIADRNYCSRHVVAARSSDYFVAAK
jgi:hypothetical protein